MRMVGVNDQNVPMSTRRILALATAIGCHLGLLLIILRPASQTTIGAPAVESDAVILTLRIVSPSSSAPHPTTSASSRTIVRQGVTTIKPTSPLARRMARTSDHSAAVSIGTPTTDSPSTPTFAPAISDQGTPAQASSGDGGFQQRLLDAQQSHGAKSIPGSDHRVAPGIQLTDPMNQGVGAVMRDTQRLFGITNRHCIDVEVWQSLSPDELSARHLTPADVRRDGEKYNCNRPLGLSL